MQARQEPMSREDVARAWFEDEYGPVIEMAITGRPWSAV